MGLSLSDIQSQIKEKSIKFLSWQFCTMHGEIKEVLSPVRDLEGVIEDSHVAEHSRDVTAANDTEAFSLGCLDVALHGREQRLREPAPRDRSRAQRHSTPGPARVLPPRHVGDGQAPRGAGGGLDQSSNSAPSLRSRSR